MDLEELNAMWAKDCKIDETNLGTESSKIPELHNKYYTEYVKSFLKVKKCKADLLELERAKNEYYSGIMDELELKSRGWKPYPIRLLRTDVAKYIESDKDIIVLSLKIDFYLSLANYLEDIIKQIHSRSFIISNILNWEKFRAGG